MQTSYFRSTEKKNIKNYARNKESSPYKEKVGKEQRRSRRFCLSFFSFHFLPLLLRSRFTRFHLHLSCFWTLTQWLTLATWIMTILFVKFCCLAREADCNSLACVPPPRHNHRKIIERIPLFGAFQSIVLLVAPEWRTRLIASIEDVPLSTNKFNNSSEVEVPHPPIDHK